MLRMVPLPRFAGADKMISFSQRSCARGMPYNRMIPKSGYRFSDKIMRKRQSITPLSTIASRLNRRWDRFFGSIMLGAHLFRMALRLSGLQQQIKGSRTPPGACLPMVRISGCGSRNADKCTQSAHTKSTQRSPDGVPPRYLRPRTNAAAQLQNALPGT